MMDRRCHLAVSPAGRRPVAEPLGSRRGRRRPRAAGFTLIELLVVMGIIILIAAVSIPAFRFITGSRSVDGAQNSVNAMIGRARTQAIVSGNNCGVFFFVDPRNDRTTMALVQQNSGDAEYSGWSMTDTGQPGTPPAVQYYDQSNPDILPSNSLQLVQTSTSGGSTKDAFIAGGSRYQRPASVAFQCIKSHLSQNGTQLAVVGPYANSFWNSNSNSLEIVRDTDFQLLPQGVGAAVVIDPLDVQSWGIPNLGVDRYVRTGCVMFDGQGRFASLPYDVFSTSKLGQELMITNATMNMQSALPLSMSQGSNPAAALPLFSGFGVVLFDRQALLADAKVNQYTEGDYLYANSTTGNNYHLPPPPYGLPYATTDTVEAMKEKWLDTNGLLLTATRYNGAMTRGE